jgi:cytochrome o ubiquinol oxidase subunit IV
MGERHIDSSGASRGSFRSYGVGFILSVVLTAIAFGLVTTGTLSRTVLLCGIFSTAVAQILVHLHCFLHLDTCSKVRWNVIAIVVTVLIF